MKILGDIRRPISRKCVLVCLAAMVSVAFPVLANAQSKQSSGVRSINLAQHDVGVLAVYNVILDRRFDAAEVDTLSHRIKRTAPKTELIFISYFLRGMKSEQEPWASSHFNPRLDSFVVRINETTTKSNPPDSDLRIAGQ